MSIIRRLLHPGSRPTTAPVVITLWGKTDCSLCDRAHAILDRLARDYPVRVVSRDILTVPAAFERYRLVIPVVEIEGGPCFELKISEHRLRQALDAMVVDRRNP